MRNALCPYYGECVGCSIQHIEYNDQLEDKKNKIKQNIKVSDIEIYSDKEYGYRNRMEFLFNKSGPALRRKNNSLINVTNCVIANDKINSLLKELLGFKNLDPYDFRKGTGTLCYAVIRTSSNHSAISFVLNEDSSKIKSHIEYIQSFSNKSSADSIIITYTNPKKPDSVSEEFFSIKGPDYLIEELLGYSFEYSIQGFFQNNLAIAKKIHIFVNDLLKKYQGQNINLLDLYAGVGTFGIINSKYFKNISIVEGFNKCLESANKNITNNNIINAKTILMDAKRIKNLTLNKPIIAIIDPPRSGMHPDTISELNNLNPKSIIYISCNLEKLKKDLLKFKNYKKGKVALFDQFPQTNHIETIIELNSNSI